MTTRPVSTTLARHQEQLIWQRALRRLAGPPPVAAAATPSRPPSQKAAQRARVTAVTAAPAIPHHLDMERR